VERSPQTRVQCGLKPFRNRRKSRRRTGANRLRRPAYPQCRRHRARHGRPGSAVRRARTRHDPDAAGRQLPVVPERNSSTQDYPSSLMGVVALLRQTYLDADWYKTAGAAEEKNLSLDAWNDLQALPQIFEAGDKLDVLRIARHRARVWQKIHRQNQRRRIPAPERNKSLRATADRAAQLPRSRRRRRSLRCAQRVACKDLKHWELAPSNPGPGSGSGIPFALTTEGPARQKKVLGKPA
jgi:hypothetical protein